jgi:hypothetical protein
LLSLSLSLSLSLTSQHLQLPNARSLHQQMHQATLRTCTPTHTTKQKKRIWTWKIFDLTSSVIHSLFHTFIHLAVQFLIHSFYSFVNPTPQCVLPPSWSHWKALDE